MGIFHGSTDSGGGDGSGDSGSLSSVASSGSSVGVVLFV